MPCHCVLTSRTSWKKKNASDMNIKLPSISPPARTILDLIMFATKDLLKVEKDEGPPT